MEGTDDTPAGLRDRAARYRNMLFLVSDPRIISALISLAEEYETLAERLERQGPHVDAKPRS
jgi:hypothetical protein